MELNILRKKRDKTSDSWVSSVFNWRTELYVIRQTTIWHEFMIWLSTQSRCRRTYGGLLAVLYGGHLFNRESSGGTYQSITSRRKSIRRRVVLSFLRWDSFGGYQSLCLTRQTFATMAVDIRVQSCSWVPSESLLFCLISPKEFWKRNEFWSLLYFFCSLRAIATPQHFNRLTTPYP